MLVSVSSSTPSDLVYDKPTVPIVRTLDSEIDRISEKYEKEESVVRAVIGCESQLYGDAINHNLDKNGKIWSTDHSWLQINDYYHTKPMKDLGLDIENKWDALEYGFVLMKKEGLKPWKSSKACWSKIIK